MTVRRLGGALLATVALALPTDATAQRTASITPAITFTHDDNILRLPDSRRAGRRTGDYSVTPSLNVNINQALGRQQLFVQGQIGYTFYRRNKQLERENILLTGGAVINSGRCQVSPTLTYERRQSDLADLFLFPGDLKNTEQVVRPGISVGCNSAGGLSSSLAYEHEDRSNSDDRRAFNDFSADIYSAQIGLARPSLGNVSIYANHRRGRYDGRSLFGGGVEQVESTSVGLKLERQLGRIRGQVSAGVTRVKSNAPGVRPFTGPSYGVALTYLGSGRLTATVGANRNITQSNLLGVSYGINDAGFINLGYALNDRTGLRAGYAITRRRFEQSPLVPTVGRLNDRTTDLTGGVSVRVASRAELDFGATFRKRRSNEPLFDYDARILALSLRFR